jgi:hypothetical protein
MKIKVLENMCANLDLDTVNNGNGIVIINGMPRIPIEFIVDGKLDIFKENYRVKDVYRYKITITNNIVQNNLEEFNPLSKGDGRKFLDKYADEVADTDKNILLLLESPHHGEYKKLSPNDKELTPIAPAQGSTGITIKTHIITVIKEIISHHQSQCLQELSGKYNLIIANPVPYCCSLGVFQPKDKLMKDVRNHIWEKVWFSQSNKKYPIQDDFITRYEKYSPVVTLNCCTEDLRNYVTQLLCDKNKHCVFQANHPAINWGKKNFGINLVC